MPSDEWVSIDAAAAKTSEPVRTWRWRAKQESDAAAREGRASLAFQGSPLTGKGRQVWYVHRSMHTLLARVVDQAVKDREPLIVKYPAHLVERALRRRVYLDRWRKLCRESSGTEIAAAERIVAEAKRTEAASFRISVRSLARWWREFNRGGVVGLIDKYNGPAAAGVDPDAPRSQDAIDAFYELYRTENRLSVRTCHEVVLRDAKRSGWSWSPSYAATAAWLRKTDDLSTSFLMRHGPGKWSKRYMPYIETDWTTVEPGEFYVCDHAQCDFWVTHKGKQIRPWLTAIQDCRSRSIVGWHLGPAPHQDAILSALRMAFRDRAIPRLMRIDNGKDFTSKLLTGITKRERDQLRREYGRDWAKVIRRDNNLSTCSDKRWLGVIGELGIELIYAIPYAPWSKGIIERFFGTFHDQLGKTFATYCGASSVRRPECLADIKRGYTRDQRRALKRKHGSNGWMKEVVLKFVDTSDVPTLEQASVRVGDYLDVYHAAAHRGRGMNGRSPREVWSTAARLRRAARDELLFLMDMRGDYRVGGNGVRLTVGGASLGYGARSAPLRRWCGRDVLVAMDTADLSHCWALDPVKRTLIGRLEANKLMPAHATTDDAREAIAEQMRDRKVMRQAARSSARRTRTATQRIAAVQRERAVEARSTGTDDGHFEPRIVPVTTNFESVSNAARSDFETTPFRPEDEGDIEDLFDGPERLGVVDDGYDPIEDMEDLLIDEPTIDAESEGLEEL